MSYQYKILDCFKKQFKRYQRKFPHLKEDLIFCLEGFRKETAISLGHHNYKVRMVSSDLKKGKSGGFRVIIHLLEQNGILIPIAIFFKSDTENISKSEINDALKQALQEMES